GGQPQHENLCTLNTNESPFPPSPKVGEASARVFAQQADELRLYPAPESDDLRAGLAELYNLDINQVFVGNGSDEVLALGFASFFLKERPVLAPDISYRDRKSTRLNSSHVKISYAVFCLKKKKL